MIPPTIIDIEASGFGCSSYPIEIGVVRSDGLKYGQLIKPFDNWTFWQKGVEAIHGISKDYLLLNGTNGVRICLELNEMLRHEQVFSDGWVVDSAWLTKLYARSGIEMDFTLSPLELILKEEQMNVWHETKKMVMNQMCLQAHRAINDALIIQRTFLKTSQLSYMPFGK